MNKKTFFLVFLLVFLSVMLQAQDGKRRWPNMLNNLQFGLHMAENNLFEAHFILHLKTEINLTAQQEKKIEDLILAHEEAAIRRGSDIKVLELKFASLLKNNGIDRKEMEKMAREMGQLKTDLQVDHLNYLLDVRDTLTPEQIQKIEKLKKDFPERSRDHGREGRDDFPRRPMPDNKEENSSQPEKH